MAITTGSEVKKAAGLTNEYTDDEILTEIDIVEAELYNKYYLPKRSQLNSDVNYTKFYINQDSVHEVIRIQVQVDTVIDESGYLIIGSTTGSVTNWEFTPGNNFITFGSDFLIAYNNKVIRVQHIPKLFNLIATSQAALNLVEPTTIVDGPAGVTPQISNLKSRLERYMNLLKPRTIVLSKGYIDYDPYDYISIDQTNYR